MEQYAESIAGQSRELDSAEEPVGTGSPRDDVNLPLSKEVVPVDEELVHWDLHEIPGILCPVNRLHSR
jgi:hypothetical protein